MAVIIYIFWLMKEIFLSSIAVTKIIWNFKYNINPEYITLDTSNYSELKKLIYSSSITLTPGTITADIINGDILVHVIDKKFSHDMQENIMAKKVCKLFKE